MAFREISGSTSLTLPVEATLVHFEDDGVTQVPANATPDSKVDFRFARYPEVVADWRANISDHCPVKVWF